VLCGTIIVLLLYLIIYDDNYCYFIMGMGMGVNPYLPMDMDDPTRLYFCRGYVCDSNTRWVFLDLNQHKQPLERILKILK
jgi:hypothetical protein